MHKYKLVSYPRSGRNMVKNRLLQCTRECQVYAPDDVVPKDADIVDFFHWYYSEDHDYHSRVKYDPKLRYLFLYRNPVRTMVSHAKIYKHGNGAKSVSAFKAFCDNRTFGLPQWAHMMNKWYSPGYPNVMCLAYEDIVHEPVTNLAKILEWVGLPSSDAVACHLVGARQPTDRKKRLRQVKRIKPIKNLERWEFYEQEINYLRSIEKRPVIKDIMDKASIPGFEDKRSV